jgi:hypothetical protein
LVDTGTCTCPKSNTFRVKFRLAVIRYGVLRAKSSLDLCFHSDKTPLQELRIIRVGNSTDLLGYPVWSATRKLAGNGVRGDQRATDTPNDHRKCLRGVHFVRLGQRATITGIRNGAGFPNLRSKIQAKFELILQELGLLHSRDSHGFRSAPNKLENCAKLLKRLSGEVPEWFNGSVC